MLREEASMKNKSCLLIIVIILVVINCYRSNASWKLMSVDDLLEQSSIILIGEVGEMANINQKDEM